MPAAPPATQTSGLRRGSADDLRLPISGRVGMSALGEALSADHLRAALVVITGRVVLAAIVLVGYGLAAKAADRLVRRLARSADAREVAILLGRSTRLAIVGLGVISALGTVGINVAGLVAGLGLTGFAVGFALKDALSNALCGILILVYRPFRRGDHISITGFEGTVTSIDLRYTTIEVADGSRVLVPNASSFSNPITVARRAMEPPRVAGRETA